MVLPQFSEDALRKHVARGDAVASTRGRKVCGKREQKAWRAAFAGKCAERNRARRDHDERVALDALYDEMGRRQRALHAASTSCGRSARSARRSSRWRASCATLYRRSRRPRGRLSKGRSSAGEGGDRILPRGAVPRRGGAQAGGTKPLRKERERVQREQAKHGAVRARSRRVGACAGRLLRRRRRSRPSSASRAPTRPELAARGPGADRALLRGHLDHRKRRDQGDRRASRRSARTSARPPTRPAVTTARVVDERRPGPGLQGRPRQSCASLGVCADGPRPLRDAVARLVGARAPPDHPGARAQPRLCVCCLIRPRALDVARRFVFRRALGAERHGRYFSSPLERSAPRAPPGRHRDPPLFAVRGAYCTATLRGARPTAPQRFVLLTVASSASRKRAPWPTAVAEALVRSPAQLLDLRAREQLAALN